MEPTTRQVFVWKKVHDKLLLREVIALEPFKHRSGSKERGAILTQIAENLNGLAEYEFKASQRSVRERLDKLLKDFDKREKEEANASGIVAEFDEIQQALTEIKERMSEADNARESEKSKQAEEKAKAGEMRAQAMERLKETKRRVTSESQLDEGSKRRKSSSNVFDIMRESVECKKDEMAVKKRELDLQQKRLEQQDEIQKQLLSQQQAQQEQQQAMQLETIKFMKAMMDKFVK